MRALTFCTELMIAHTCFAILKTDGKCKKTRQNKSQSIVSSVQHAQCPCAAGQKNVTVGLLLQPIAISCHSTAHINAWRGSAAAAMAAGACHRITQSLEQSQESQRLETGWTKMNGEMGN
jgi:hypothetical protein